MVYVEFFFYFSIVSLLVLYVIATVTGNNSDQNPYELSDDYTSVDSVNDAIDNNEDQAVIESDYDGV